ncbi:hypothetical protein FHX74_001558 [Friedmanniella endophytica]|uniref:Uncharacterized protein n=1 Tax=Microlunatus kandeliicorticis TaxID=1759536 RepID=A0A7W3IRQ6_9ACTN|nr:hypothetical protein [Microlunatus kandeliicorticis]MBA8793953.1 hypothetical protein [Microlunatus kandeliicorticis]
MRLARITSAVIGIALLVWGVRLLLNYPWPVLISLGTWLVAAVLIQDGLLSPLVLLIAAGLRRLPARPRRFVQFGLVAAFPAVVITVPMALVPHLADPRDFPRVKALLVQPYPWHLVLIIGLLALGCLVGWAVRVARDRSTGREPVGPPTS